MQQVYEWISVIGSSRLTESEYSQAVEVGKILGSRGKKLVTGGLGGVMEAVAKGASLEGATVIGLLPGETRASANPYVIPIPTGLGEARNLLVVRAGDLIIAMFGGYGTLSELAFAMKLNKPIIAYRSWNEVLSNYSRSKVFSRFDEFTEYLQYI